MTYRVVISQRATDDLRSYYVLAAEHAPGAALQWLNRFEIALASLSSNPERCPLAPEDNLIDTTVRQLFFGKRAGRFRALFTVRGQDVLVLHIRRGTMDKASAAELTE
jgi:toxin ParE1/3/4